MLSGTQADQITAIDYDKENPVNAGSLCPRGHYNFELLNHPEKTDEPIIGEGRLTWDAAIDAFKETSSRNMIHPRSAFFFHSNASNEDAYRRRKNGERTWNC